MSSSYSLICRSSIGLTILLIAFACTTRPTNVHAPPSQAQASSALREGEDSDGDPAPSDDEYVHQQGTKLQALPPDLEGFSVDTTKGWFHRGTALSGVAVVDGELVVAGPHPMTASDLVGTTFTATLRDGGTTQMRIADVVRPVKRRHEPPPADRQREYVLQYAVEAGRWASVCPAEAPGAMPIVGSFGHTPQGHPNGGYDPEPTRLTFACSDGVAAKCQRWQYQSWRPDRQPYFQACTRMARADYCGNGQSRTVDGTVIEYLDLHELPLAKPQLLPGFLPEAVWGTEGTNAPSAAICLSRTRWSTLPLGPRSPCADILVDPRDDAASGGNPRRFCDDMTVQEWADSGARFFNYSRALDRPLVVWSDRNGRFATTTKYPWLGPGVDSPGPPGYPEFTSIEGPVIKPDAPAGVKKNMVPLVRYTRTTDAITLEILTTEGPPAGFGHPVLEGYVYPFRPRAEPPTSTARPLYVHYDDNHHYVTTTEPQAPAKGNFTKFRQIGWLPH